jgi:hypothetical protein
MGTETMPLPKGLPVIDLFYAVYRDGRSTLTAIGRTESGHVVKTESYSIKNDDALLKIVEQFWPFVWDKFPSKQRAADWILATHLAYLMVGENALGFSYPSVEGVKQKTH